MAHGSTAHNDGNGGAEGLKTASHSFKIAFQRRSDLAATPASSVSLSSVGRDRLGRFGLSPVLASGGP